MPYPVLIDLGRPSPVSHINPPPPTTGDFLGLADPKANPISFGGLPHGPKTLYLPFCFFIFCRI